MAALWRIGLEAPGWPANDLSGKGAEASGGRWNSEGVAMLYTSSSIALAVLETLGHLSSGDVPFNRYIVRIDVPDALWDAREILDPPGGWDALPAGFTSRFAGDAWCAGRRSLLLVVPSAVLPEEYNVLVNPCHADARLLAATTMRRLAFDPPLAVAREALL